MSITGTRVVTFPEILRNLRYHHGAPNDPAIQHLLDIVLYSGQTAVTMKVWIFKRVARLVVGCWNTGVYSDGTVTAVAWYEWNIDFAKARKFLKALNASHARNLVPQHDICLDGTSVWVTTFVEGENRAFVNHQLRVGDELDRYWELVLHVVAFFFAEVCA